jgi:hypothetical protein
MNRVIWGYGVVRFVGWWPRGLAAGAVRQAVALPGT